MLFYYWRQYSGHGRNSCYSMRVWYGCWNLCCRCCCGFSERVCEWSFTSCFCGCWSRDNCCSCSRCKWGSRHCYACFNSCRSMYSSCSVLFIDKLIRVCSCNGRGNRYWWDFEFCQDRKLSQCRCKCSIGCSHYTGRCHSKYRTCAHSCSFCCWCIACIEGPGCGHICRHPACHSVLTFSPSIIEVANSGLGFRIIVG